MDHSGYDFLAHAALAADEHGHVHRCDLKNLLADPHHLGAGGQEAQVFGHLVAIIAQHLIFRGQLLLLPGLQHCRVELRLLERLGQIIVCSNANGFDDRSYLVRAGKHDDVEAAVDLHQFLQRLDAVHLRHQYIQDDEVGPLALVHFLDRFSAGADRLDVESIDFQQRLQVLSNAGFVVNHENFFFRGHWLFLSITKILCH